MKARPTRQLTLVEALDLGARAIKKKEGRVHIYLCDITKPLHLELVENYPGSTWVSALKQVLAIHNTASQITTDLCMSKDTNY